MGDESFLMHACQATTVMLGLFWLVVSLSAAAMS
jgi:hypothetical protein